ncbi:hypothetical protein EVAR_7437_1 [Eumeta japonica]|uniref:Uncharacterized protein n=1 Tax=Eumeta variegata TaxID=151549 RepID=A0A4C1V8Q6_EUMVA|nr:hypothetical protein EVAR_7437_1 [Eumeta japonica]
MPRNEDSAARRPSGQGVDSAGGDQAQTGPHLKSPSESGGRMRTRTQPTLKPLSVRTRRARAGPPPTVY